MTGNKAVIGSKEFYVRRFVNIQESALETVGPNSATTTSDWFFAMSDSFSAREDGDIEWILKIGLPTRRQITLSLSSNPRKYAVFAYAVLLVQDYDPQKRFGGLEEIPKASYKLVNETTPYVLTVPTTLPLPLTGEITFVVEIAYKIFGAINSAEVECVKDVSLPSCVAKLQNDEKFSDFLIICNKQSFPVHKCILAARSPYFAGLFSTKLKEDKEGVLNLKDGLEDIAAFGAMIEYIYTDKVQEMDGLETELLALADRFQLEGLKALCQSALISQLTASNSADLFLLADKFNAKPLRKAALSTLCTHMHVACKSREWKEIVESSPELASEVVCKVYE